MCYSKLFLFLYLYPSEMCFYSGGLHSSRYGGHDHYTIFGFREQGGRLKQGWSMHVDEDGSSKCVIPSKNRCIYWGDITMVRTLDSELKKR